MAGLDGNDTYIVDDATDIVHEVGGNRSGTDTIISYLDSYTLSSDAVFGFVENLVLGGTSNSAGTGNGLANLITGNAGANSLSGADGVDTLIGGAGNDTLTGGLGIDSLVGGTGNDSYVLDADSDIVVEQVGEGTDTVSSSVSYALGANLENLVLSGSATVNGQGNELDNLLTGNGVANTLTGLAGNDTLDGGAGNDTLVGGTGNDTYIVDSAGDVVTELAGQGIDTIITSVNYVLAAGAEIENLTLAGSATQLTGNEIDNTLTGGALDDSLSGGAGNDSLIGAAGNDTLVGGTGNDTMVGGLGDDTYVVDAAGDVITEAAGVGSGTDTVQASVSTTLSDNVENLVLTGALASTAPATP
jgi:Ca2+-binding RTX toxin-like protein